MVIAKLPPTSYGCIDIDSYVTVSIHNKELAYLMIPSKKNYFLVLNIEAGKPS